jgi:hypothetical protein
VALTSSGPEAAATSDPDFKPCSPASGLGCRHPKIRLTVSGNQPPDVNAFFAHYGTVHSGLALAIPGTT